MEYIAGRPPVGVNIISIIYYVYNLTGHFSLVIFVKLTFYNERKSFFTLILVSTLTAKICYVITLVITELTLSAELNNIVQGFATFIILYTSLWLSFASFSAYHKIKSSKIQPWVKKRYLIVGISAIFLGAQSFPNILVPYRVSFEPL